MTSDKRESPHTGLVVRQWLPEWEKIKFDEAIGQAKPLPAFYLFSLPAPVLRALSGIHRRDASEGGPRAVDLSIQRRHDPERSQEIRRFVSNGYPLSTLGKSQRADPDNAHLQKPGWLPTAIVVNILAPGDQRRSSKLEESDALKITVDSDSRTVMMGMPESWVDHGWKPMGTHPIEVIDGQHRLWAFDQIGDQEIDFDLPVVAFRELDISWQAYLFWTINIKPKKINASLAFDLYPLLREQDWLLAGEGVMVYRETRAQELTEALWGTPESPWYRRINMLGDTGVRSGKPVTQAAFVRSLTSTFVRAWKHSRSALGGLYGGAQTDYEGLRWPRVQQAAFLVACWRSLSDAISETDSHWASVLRESEGEAANASVDPAFASAFSLLASDQGVRPVLSVFNDSVYVVASKYRLAEWQISESNDDVTPENVEDALAQVEQHPIAKFVRSLSNAMATYDWRNSKAPGLKDEEKTGKLVFRGSGGYTELRRQLLQHIIEHGEHDVSEAAELVVGRT